MCEVIGEAHVCHPSDPECAAALAAVVAIREATGHVCDFTNRDCQAHLFYAHPSNRARA